MVHPHNPINAPHPHPITLQVTTQLCSSALGDSKVSSPKLFFEVLSARLVPAPNTHSRLTAPLWWQWKFIQCGLLVRLLWVASNKNTLKNFQPGLPWGSAVKESTCRRQETRIQSLIREDPTSSREQIQARVPQLLSLCSEPGSRNY